MAVLVELLTISKSGKALRVLLGGTWYNASLTSGLNGQVGKYIEAEIQIHEKFGPGIQGWKPAGIQAPPQTTAAPQLPPPPPANPSPPAAAAVPTPQTTREPVYAEPNRNVAPWFMPFVSNVVAHAIQAGLIKEPAQIRAWLIAAKTSATAHDDGIPF